MTFHLRTNSLTTRLVLTAVGLVAVVGVLVAVTTTIALRSYLLGQLDHDVRGTWSRAVHDLVAGPNPRSDPDALSEEQGPLGQASGTLTAAILGTRAYGNVLTETAQSTTQSQDLTAAQLQQLYNLPRDGVIHHVDLTGVGSYRVVARVAGPNGLVVVSGLPTTHVDNTVHQVVLWELILTALGVVLAGLAGSALVRHQLRPLQEVAATAHAVSEQQLGTGEIDITARVDDRLTDTNTEVGQVGAALNRMLGHVEDALTARHRSEQQVRSFVADASHELRTPLATILGYAELARRKGDQELLSDALSKVEVEATRMSTLVEDLLLLARLDAGRPLAEEDVDVTHLVLEAVADARVVAPRHKWMLELPDEPVSVAGDTDRIHQVVSNLLSNARRHTPEGTTVTVSLDRVGDVAELVVSDDGPGIDPEVLPTVFERFSRSDDSRSRESGGVGLGLALAKAIVAAHGGTIEATPSDSGARFVVRLPGAASA